MYSAPPATSVFLVLYSSIFLLALNGLFANAIPLDATSITQIRSVIGAICLCTLLLSIKRPIGIIGKKQLLGTYGLGVLMGLHWVTYFHSMQVSTIAIGMLALYTYTIMTVLLEAIIHRRRPRLKDCLLSVLVIVGVVIMSYNSSMEGYGNVIEGILWGVLSALLFSIRNLVQKYQFHDVASDRLMLHQMIAIALLFVAFVDIDSTLQLSLNSWVKLALLGTFTTALAHILLIKSYNALSAKKVAMISCLQPVIGAVLGWLVLGEQITIYIVTGGGIILLVAVYESLQPVVKRN